MMNYELFKEVVMEKFKDYMSEEFKDYELVMTPVEKVNQVKDGIHLVAVGDKTIISPTLYINDIYEYYKENEDLNESIRLAAENMERAFKDRPFEKEMLDFDSAKDNIVFQLVNTEQNKEMLKGVNRTIE